MNEKIKKPLMANHNPTPLEALKKCEWSLGENGWLKYRRKDISIIKTALNKAKKQEKELEKRSELEEFAKLCATKHVRLHYLGLPLKTYNEKVMFDTRERGYYRLPLTESEYDLARKVMDEYGKK